MEGLRLKIRDRRNKGWFFLDNEIIDKFGWALGPVGIAIYGSLARHADQYQKCFPSQKYIANEFGISERIVRTHIKLLIDLRLIRIAKRGKDNGKWRVNVYELLDRTEWIRPEAPDAPGHEGQKISKKEARKRLIHRNHVPTKDTQYKETLITKEFKEKRERLIDQMTGANRRSYRNY